ncbi:MAG: penicillin acylase family protein [Ignavibacteria bacterium]|nr:penicillin acylase family protein [Ignavibacteria bacterium]
MPRFLLSKNTIGIILVVIVFLITSVYLFQNLSGKSEYSEQGIFIIEDLEDTVEIYRDDFGVPHIEARNKKDMYFILGYTHAQERLWQMDFSRRIAEGRLSEIMGKDVLEYDKLYRTIGIGKAAKKIYDNLPEQTKEILKYYTDGINLFLNSNIKNLPLEFDILDYKPDEWKPEDCVSIIRLMGWELNISWYAEYNFINIINRFGVTRAMDFIPDNHPEQTYTIKKAEDSKQETVDRSNHPIIQSFNHPNSNSISSASLDVAEGLKDFITTAMEFRERFGLKGMRTGSNAFVISGGKTESRKPILANDPHISLMTPSRWYEVVLTDKTERFFISGFSVPGVPGVLIGNNNAISWGITSLMNDETDYFILNIDSISGIKIDSTIEDIKIKGQKEEYSHLVFNTKFGPVISGLSTTGFGNKQKINPGLDKIVVFKWTGYEYSDEAGAMNKINMSGNWNDFKNALRTVGVPALNFVYADTAGNIGYKTAGKIPIRRYSGEEAVITGISPNSSGMVWSGFVPFEELPQTYNPSSGYIVTANNKPQKDYRYFITYLYEPHYRAARIEELLKERNNFSADEIKLIQTDVTNLMSKELCNYLFRAANILEIDTAKKISPPVSLTETEKNYLHALKNWDFSFKSSSTAATLFAQFEAELYGNLYRKKLGEEIFANYLTLGSIPVRNTSKLMRERFLNVKIEEYKESTGRGVIGIIDDYNFENLRDVLLKSFKDAVIHLTKHFKEPDVSKWKWGVLHKVKFGHILGNIQSLSQILDLGPYEADGAGETVFSLEYSFTDAAEKVNFSSFLGTSMRFIIDMGDIRSYLSILPPGQNGQNISPHYRDQARLWLNGEYKRVQTIIGRMSMYGMKKQVFLNE